MTPSSVNWQKTASILFCATVGLLFLWLTLRHATGILLPFLLAYLLSRIVRPLATRLTRRTKLPRGASAAILVVLVTGILSALLVGGVMRGIRELTRLAEELTADTEGLSAAVDSLLSKVSSLCAFRARACGG